MYMLGDSYDDVVQAMKGKINPESVQKDFCRRDATKEKRNHSNYRKQTYAGIA